MLPAGSRLRRRPDFTLAVRHGRRAAVSSLVGHLFLASPQPVGPPRVGVIVSRAVGCAVVRNRVRRRLRHLLRDRLGELPVGSLLVVRARSRAPGRNSAQLAADVDTVLSRVTR